ncbi:T9SS type A sorting domain-containing protein [Chryseobacterium sp. SNU WT5]|uniref:T9SS type A sorting domain-containing protein n=1 Tax=Chryseobacterium sp. SNU WT5 TaxID=2594269 RepID=UPI0011804392|nr:T9SS type A sorting domain-containing protein [Chryseobacterium sp. SNU WT5]QDP84376.1 T9SS type A sorting domain-containing protein [Chryseobacterium sp. SNU WT5]
MKKIFTFLSLSAIATMSNAQIVINEVYGGGGNSGSTYKNDFIELMNTGATAATLTNATLQYASKTGTFNQYHPLPPITLNPGQTYLIQEGAGAGGTVDLTPDLIAPIPINFGGGTNTVAGFIMAAGDGKIVLASNTTQVVAPTDANVLDFVGYGAASQFEGTGAAPSPSATVSIARTGGVDSNNNSADFKTGAPTPLASLAVSDVNNIKNKLVKNTSVTNSIVFGANAEVQIINLNGQVVKSATVSENSALDVSSLTKGVYFINAEVDGKKVSQKILKN